MRGLMMDTPLLISGIITHADAIHGDREVVTRTVEGPVSRATYREIHRRARRLANALDALGLKESDRAGSIAWNTQRHLELYYAAAGSGRITHVMNPRFAADQLTYIINHAEDRALFVDLTFVPLVETIMPNLKTVETVVVLTDREHMPETTLANAVCYEELIAAGPDDYDWPQLDENAAAALCYTSGTTDHPKGVLYSHRSSVLHAMVISQAGVAHLAEDQTALAVVPMYHVMAWGYPYACPMTGTKLVMPGPALDGDSLFALMDAEKVTTAAGVPTIWSMLLGAMKKAGRAPDGLTRTVIGGSAVPEAMVEAFEQYGIEVRQAWGMTESSALGSISVPKPGMRRWPRERRFAQQAKQGRKLFGVEIEIVDEGGEALPHDGEKFGPLRVRSPWICSAYYRTENDGSHVDGWLDTGDIATIDEDGYFQITDRKKDLIKSGGEWISSIELENLAVGHPDIAAAAAIAVPDEKWGERPLLVVVAAEGRDPAKRAILDHLATRLAKWQLPDDIVFVDALPLGATGKILKTRLREQFTK